MSWFVEPAQFAVLGIGAGSVYALNGQCLVLVYRAAGIINFAQTAIGMAAAFCFYELAVNQGFPMGVALTAGILVSGLLGALVQVLLMSRLRQAASLTRLMSTLAVLTVLLTLATKRYGDLPVFVPRVLPSTLVHLGAGIVVPMDRLILLGVSVGITVILYFAFRFTRIGFATAAVAENERAVAALGISPGLIALANWTVAGLIGGLGAILLASTTGEVSLEDVVLLLIPALAAALLGGFRSFWLTLIGGLAIGIAESEMAFYVSAPGYTKSVPFIAIILVMAFRGRSLPIRGELAARGSSIGTGTITPRLVLSGAFVALGLTWLLGGDWANAIATTAVTGLIVASVIIVVGYAGQLSLAQYGIAGLAAWIAGRAIVNYGFGFETALLLALIISVPVGLLVGLPAVRIRGANLAIATLGFAVVIDQMILSNPNRGASPFGTDIGSFRLFGIPIDPSDHPERYATVLVIFLVGVLLMMANLRSSDTGRKLIAMRSNERAAAGLGINVPGLKLLAFALASVVAALGGVLLAYQNQYVSFTPFSILDSITVVLTAVIGGIGYVGGALIGGAIHPGALIKNSHRRSFASICPIGSG